MKNKTKMGSSEAKAKPIFKPRARLMVLLGDQLIRDAGIAVFELVKNAYDADAKRCIITLQNITRDDNTAKIIVEDDGHGMDLNTILNVWMEPGTEFRKEQRQRGERTQKFERLPMGEKGVGRFAAHKLGQNITLISRKAKCDEVTVTIDWQRFNENCYLSEIPVDVRERSPRHFTGRKTGTRIEIENLRDIPWSKRRIRSLHRAVTSICSPFEGPGDFAPTMEIEPSSNVLKGLLKPEEALKRALFRFSGDISGNTLTYRYRFRPRHKLTGVAKRVVKDIEMPIRYRERDPETGKKEDVSIDLDSFEIGPVHLDFFIYDREPAVLALTETDRSGLVAFLDSMGGVRVYRDGVRVYDFGEPGNDWLELGGRRVNVPAKRISNNQIIGAVTLRAACSSDLMEKTNREGFVERPAYDAFRNAVRFAIQQAEAERNKDKGRIRKLYSRSKKKEPVLADLQELRTRVEELGLQEDLGCYLDRIEVQYREVQDRLLVAAGAGLNLAAVMHEVEKGIHDLRKAIDANTKRNRLVDLAHHLSDMVDGLSWLTKKTGKARMPVSTLIHQVILNSEFRFRGHGVKVINGLDLDDPDFKMRCSRRLMTSAMMNLVDNAIYWLDNKGAKDKRIYIGTSYEINNLPGIVVADNGPGFFDPPEYLVQPFFTRKPDGIGLGLHIVEEIMKIHNGHVLFPETGDVSLPDELTGAVVFLEFGDK